MCGGGKQGGEARAPRAAGWQAHLTLVERFRLSRVGLLLLRGGWDRADRDSAVEAIDAALFSVRRAARRPRVGPRDGRDAARGHGKRAANGRDALKRGGVPLGPNMFFND